MIKLKKLMVGAAAISGVVGTAFALKKKKTINKLELENCTDEVLDFFLGTNDVADALTYENVVPGEKRLVDFSVLPLAEHDVLYIRFPEKDGRPGYQRTLIYDTDECNCAMHGMIVDYGDGNYDVKLVKVG